MQKKISVWILMKKNKLISNFFYSKPEQKNLKKSEWCKRNLEKNFNHWQKCQKKRIFVFEILQGSLYGLNLHPGVKMEQNPKSCVAWNLYSWTYIRVQVAEPLSGVYDKYEQQACLSSEQGIKRKSCLYYFLLNC